MHIVTYIQYKPYTYILSGGGIDANILRTEQNTANKLGSIVSAWLLRNLPIMSYKTSTETFCARPLRSVQFHVQS